METIEMEIVTPIDDKLVKYAGETGLEKPATETLVEAFRPVFAKSRTALADAKGVAESVKDATCVTEIRKSRACRLAIRDVRLESDETRKKHKQHALIYGRAVDGFHAILMADLAPVENALQEAEDFAERAEAARKATLKNERAFELQTLLDGPWIGADLGEIPIAAYVKVLEDARLLKQAKFDALLKVETERKARLEAERIERERITAENARLQKEKDETVAAAKEAARLAEVERIAAADKATQIRVEMEAKAAAYEKQIVLQRAEERRLALLESDRIAREVRKEREALEAKAKVEREKAAKETARLKAELAAKAQVEADALAKAETVRRAEEEAMRRAAAAPDMAKLAAFAIELRRMPRPKLADNTTAFALNGRIDDLAEWCENEQERV